MDRTLVLRELFEKNVPYVERCDSFLVLKTLSAHPFTRAFAVVTANAGAAVCAARLRITAAMCALDECSPIVGDLERALLMHEVELLSASNSIKELCASIKEARCQLEKTRNSRLNAFFSLPKRKEEDTSDSFGFDKPSLQLLEHFEIALEALGAIVGSWRLRLTLCKEELALYRQEIFIFSRAGVLSCSTSLETEVEGSEKLIKEMGGNRKETKTSGILPTLQAEGNLRSAAMVASVFDRVIKGARTMTTSPLPHAASAWSLVSGRLGERTFSEAASPQQTFVPNFVYDEEEEKKLTEANLLLEQQQKAESLGDAKAVEASVRELSQLTSLINEHVMQQNEQFSILLRNTETAQLNMQKGVGEVKKALSCFWNSTRQLIACLWISILILLFANWLIR